MDYVNIKSVGYNLKFLYRSYVLNYSVAVFHL